MQGKFNNSTIKKAFRIVFWIILSLCIVVFPVYFLLKLPTVQQKIKEIVLQEITKKTNSKISIGNLRFYPFNRLQLDDLYAADLKNDTLFYVEKLNANFNLFKLLRKQFVIHSVEFDNFELRISKDSVNAPFNFQFLVDAFASDTTQSTDNSNLRLAIDHVLLKDGHLQYNVFSEPVQTTAGLFDANHIDVRNLQLDAKLHLNGLKNWSSSVDRFSFDEKSGFALKQMNFQIKNQNDHLQIERFYISFPHSEGEIKEARLDLKGSDLNEILSKASFAVPSFTSKWQLGDFSCFYPDFSRFIEPVLCSGEIEGTLPRISIPRFELNYGKQLQLKVNTSINDYHAWETSAFQINIQKALIDTKLFELPFHSDFIAFTGKVTGSLPQLQLDLTATGAQGNAALTGSGGYNVPAKNARFNLDLDVPQYDFKTLLSDSLFGNASFHLATQGTVIGFNKINATAKAEIRRFDYMGYSYQNISADAAYANDSLSLHLVSNDAHLPLTAHGEAGLNKNNPFIQLQARLNGVYPDVIHLLPQYPASKLSGSFHALVKGFDPELMTASVAIDSLHWTTPSKDFALSPVTISYSADANSQKQISLQSSILNLRGKGIITFNGFNQSLREAFPGLFTSKYPPIKKTAANHSENFDFFIGIRQTNEFAHFLGMETTIPDSAFFAGKYKNNDGNLNFDLNGFSIFTIDDTVQARLSLYNLQNNLQVQLYLKNRSNQYELEGNMGAAVEFIPNLHGTKPDMNIAINPGSLTLNGATFNIQPAKITITDRKYEINNFALQHSAFEYIKVEGAVSDNPADSLQIRVNRFEIGTIMSALKNKIPLSGTASGDITFARLTTKPLIFSRNFEIDSLVFNGNPAGNLQLRSGWSSERQGLALRATWNPPDAPPAIMTGVFLPQKDSLAVTANIQGIRLKWLTDYFPESFYGFDGDVGIRIKINGKPADPALSGMIYLNDATAGVRTLNTKYRISDSVYFDNSQIIFRDFTVRDETNQNMKINGSIRHKRFSELNPKLTLNFERFLMLNNKDQTDSLFYGFVQANGSLNILLQNKDWLIQGRLNNGTANKIMINLPDQAVAAERYNWLTFVDTHKKDSVASEMAKAANDLSGFSFPIKFHITLSVDPNLSIGAIFNPETKDAATVAGRGIIDFSYNLLNPDPRLQGNYVIDNGKCTLSFMNIAKRTFSVQPGGKLNFQGDPMNTTFDLTAVYGLRAYLTSLDPSFASLLSAAKIPVNCLLTASGKLDDMRLKYRIELPDQTDDIQRKLDGLIYTDEIMIKEIAYLLAFGSFMPVNSANTGNSSIWTSLASSSVTSQLNNLLSGILKENWTIGTNLYSKDANFSNIDMDLNVSTRLFNDRLMFNGTVGYHNSGSQTNNFTGDFKVDYKLTSSGNLLLQFYNVTNNQYYDKSKSPLTQGVGIVYKRESRTFRQLFRNILRPRQRTNTKPPTP